MCVHAVAWEPLCGISIFLAAGRLHRWYLLVFVLDPPSPKCSLSFLAFGGTGTGNCRASERIFFFLGGQEKLLRRSRFFLLCVCAPCVCAACSAGLGGVQAGERRLGGALRGRYIPSWLVGDRALCSLSLFSHTRVYIYQTKKSFTRACFGEATADVLSSEKASSELQGDIVTLSHHTQRRFELFTERSSPV